MGYCMYVNTIENVKFKVEDAAKVLKAIQNLTGQETIEDSSGKHFSWVKNNFATITDLGLMFKVWRWPIEKKGPYYHITEFIGEKAGDELEFFDAIAPFMSNGRITMMGEDHAYFGWEFKNKSVTEIDGQVIFDDILEVFMKEYKDALPPKLYTELEKFRVAQEV
jgi:hypothetical protein